MEEINKFFVTEEEAKGRTAEFKTLAKAKQVIEEASGGAASLQHNFLQLSTAPTLATSWLCESCAIYPAGNSAHNLEALIGARKAQGALARRRRTSP